MKIGFTGTQDGMRSAQLATFARILQSRFGEFHHGDCIGSDKQSHEVARDWGFKIILHPPSNPSKRAFCQADEVREKKPYLDRNKDIVKETEELIATPSGFEEELRSGTWSTVRYARKLGRRVTIIWPDGSVRIDGD